jgi:DNA-binding transcriptional MerR regulator
MAMQLSQKRALDTPAIPDRLYFKIGDVARICAVETYVLRFWETQFPQLKPNKSGTGQRLYRRQDVELALRIKHLVHTEGYTISGARQALELERGRPHRQLELASEAQPMLPLVDEASAPTREELMAQLADLRAELREIAGMLAAEEAPRPRRRARVTTMPSKSGSLFPN